MIPHQITRSQLLHAIQLLKCGDENVPPPRRSKKYDLRYKGHRYPPKYVVAVAYKEVGGDYLHGFGVSETHNFLTSRGFTVVRKDGTPVDIAPTDEDEESSFPEGREKYRMHRSLERDSKISKLAKRRRLERLGQLSCDVCSFSFHQRYGGLGIGYIEAHHTVPVSELRGKQKTKLADIALVCSNCHRMLHYERPWLSIKDLKRHLNK
jgi:5-methylcytosine-specific restriction endonuclease McrA